MNRVVDFYNGIVTQLCQILFAPFKEYLGLGLITVSAFCGVLFLYLYGKVSNQTAIRDTKRQIYTLLLEVALFRKDLRVILTSQLGLFKQAFRYLFLAVPPLLVLIIPCLLLLAQLNLYFGNVPLALNQNALITIVSESTSDLFNVSISAPEELELTPALRASSERSIYLRASAHKDGEHEMSVRLGDHTILTQPVYSGPRPQALPQISVQDWWLKLLYPGGSSLSAPITQISIDYPAYHLAFAGLKLHWVLVFFIVSLISGLIASKVMGVEV